MAVTESAIVAGLEALQLGPSSVAIVHSSLRSFGYVEGGAAAVCRALAAGCGTVLLPASTWDLTGLWAPPGLVRPHNACLTAATWEEFNAAIDRAVPFALDLPVDRELGLIPETMRRSFAHERSTHPLVSYLGVGPLAGELVRAQRLDFPLGPIERLAELGGDVLLLGVTHTSNTTIHLAEQRLGRSCFYRYAKVDDHLWMELPNIPGESHKFDAIDPELAPLTREVLIGRCRARRVAVADVLATADRLIRAEPAALLCRQPGCRCEAALQQRLARIADPAG